MAISSFGPNANGSVRSEDSRSDNPHPICSPRHLLLPFSRLFQGRICRISKKSRKRRQWIEEVKARRTRPAKTQTPYPAASTILIPLKARTKEAESISVLDLADAKTGLGNEGLGQLPPELRRQIYKLVFGKEDNVLVLLPSKIRAVPETWSVHHWLMAGQGYHNPRFLSDYSESNDARFCANRPAILRTCRQIYIEAVELLYSENTFVFKDAATFTAFTKAVVPRRLNAIRKIRIYFCEAVWPCIPPNVQHEERENGCGEEFGREGIPEDEEEWHSFPSSVATCTYKEILKRRQWYWCWTTIASMQNLTSLDTLIDYKPKRSQENEKFIYRDILRPLLQVDGIRDFKLKCRVVIDCRQHGVGWRDMRWRDDVTRVLVEQIERGARLPREIEDVGEDDEMGMELMARGACGCLHDVLYDVMCIYLGP